MEQQDSSAAGDVIHEQILRLWADGLAPASVSSVTLQGRVPEPTLRLLANAGLPSTCPLEVTFYRDERFLQPVSSAAGATYLLVGDDFGTTLGLGPGSGEVWSFELDEKSSPRFVNSSLDAFVLFLGLYEKDGNTAPLSDTERVAAAEELGREMTRYDSAALGDEESWWSIILEQRMDGLL